MAHPSRARSGLGGGVPTAETSACCLHVPLLSCPCQGQQTRGTDEPRLPLPCPRWGSGWGESCCLNMELVFGCDSFCPLLGRRGTLGTSSCQGWGGFLLPFSQGPACESLIIAMAVMIEIPSSASPQPACHYPHFADEETEARKGKPFAPESHLGLVGLTGPPLWTSSPWGPLDTQGGHQAAGLATNSSELLPS